MATELVVFDCGLAKARCSWMGRLPRPPTATTRRLFRRCWRLGQSTRLPSVEAFPQCLRIACPMLGVSAGIAGDVLQLFPKRSLRRSRELRRILCAAGLLVGPGLLSFVNAILAARAFLDGGHVEHLKEVRCLVGSPHTGQVRLRETQ